MRTQQNKIAALHRHLKHVCVAGVRLCHILIGLQTAQELVLMGAQHSSRQVSKRCLDADNRLMLASQCIENSMLQHCVSQMLLCGSLQRVSVWLHPHVPSGVVHIMALTGHCTDDVDNRQHSHCCHIKLCVDCCAHPSRLCRQLYLNYRLKSVAHLPWRQMSYK